MGLFNDRFARPLKPIKNTTIRAGRHRDGSHPHLRAFRSCRFVLGIVERFLAGGNKWQQPDEILKVRIAEGLVSRARRSFKTSYGAWRAELLGGMKRIFESLPNETTPDEITRDDAAVGQFLWLALHEAGHASFDMLDVPIFGSAEDAADNFATYIILQFGKNQARRLILGAAWAWRAYLGDYKKNPVVPVREMARKVLDTNWLESLESQSVSPK